MNKHGFVDKSTIQYVRWTLRQYGVKLVCTKRQYKCEAFPKGAIVYLTPWMNEVEFFNAAAHELQHVINYRTGKYPAYHSENLKRFVKATKYHGLQAEIYTDKQAAKLIKGLFPWVKYYSWYRTKAAQWFYKYDFKREVANAYNNR